MAIRKVTRQYTTKQVYQWGNRFAHTSPSNGGGVSIIGYSDDDIIINPGYIHRGDSPSVRVSPNMTLNPVFNYQFNGTLMEQFDGKSVYPLGYASATLDSPKGSFSETILGRFEIDDIQYLAIGVMSSMSDTYGGDLTYHDFHYTLDHHEKYVDVKCTWVRQYTRSNGKILRANLSSTTRLYRNPTLYDFRSKEYSRFIEAIDLRPDGSDPFLYQSAFLSAYENIPRNASNNIDNIKRTVDAVRNPLKTVSDFVTTLQPCKLSKAHEKWLAYRYSYKTTMYDLDEVPKMAAYRQAVFGHDIRKTQGSVSYTTMNGLTAQLGCHAYYRNGDDPTGIFLRLCAAYGVSPSLTNFWDMVPMSFVFDWFLCTDRLVKRCDVAFELQADMYDFLGVCYTHKCSTESDLLPNIQQIAFSRTVSGTIPDMSLDVTVLQDAITTDTSWIGANSTCAKRFLDAVCILIGLHQ